MVSLIIYLSYPLSHSFIVDDKVTPIWNTMAVIPGLITDEVVLVGNHRDGWYSLIVMSKPVANLGLKLGYLEQLIPHQELSPLTKLYADSALS